MFLISMDDVSILPECYVPFEMWQAFVNTGKALSLNSGRSFGSEL